MSATQPMAGLDRTTVRDAMHAGIVSCPAATPLADVADAMVAHRVHAVAVAAVREDPVHGEFVAWGLATDLDIARAVADHREAATASDIARPGAPTVSKDAGLRHAAELMAEHGATHLIVADGPLPEGVISALDVAATLAGSRGARSATAPPPTSG